MSKKIDTKLEVELIRRFVTKEKQNRLVDFVSNPKSRDKFFNEIASPSIFDQRCVTEISGSQRSVGLLPDLYKEYGMSGRVYVMSAYDEWDGRKFQMSYIVDECLAQCVDTIGYCWKTKLGFYEWHHSGASYFLKKEF